MNLHLDSIYRNRFQKFYLSDGRVFDSRQYNWRQIEWEKVVKILTSIRNIEYWVDCCSPTFLFFMNYRTAGTVWNVDPFKFKLVKQKIAEWNVGWSDGQNVVMKDIDFKTGKLKKEYKKKLMKEHNEHIHPRVKHLVFKKPIIIGV